MHVSAQGDSNDGHLHIFTAAPLAGAVPRRGTPAALRSAGPGRLPCHNLFLHLAGKIDTLRYMVALYIVLQSRLWLAFSREPHLSMIAGSIRRRSLPDRQDGLFMSRRTISRSTVTATATAMLTMPIPPIRFAGHMPSVPLWTSCAIQLGA